MIKTILGGRYEILEEIGKGGMAYVYKARCVLLNRIVAVKVLREDLEGGDEFLKRFNTEAQAAASLTHQNIVSIFDVGEDNGKHYIVMEYVDGITLKEYILKNLPDAKVVCQSCPLFVPLVEEGWYSADDVVVSETIKRYLEPMIEEGVDTLILGCTHYPILEKAISAVLGDGVKLINAGTATAQAVLEFLKEKDMLKGEGKGNLEFFVSDKADSFRHQASILLGKEIDDSKVKTVSL